MSYSSHGLARGVFNARCEATQPTRSHGFAWPLEARSSCRSRTLCSWGAVGTSDVKRAASVGARQRARREANSGQSHRGVLAWAEAENLRGQCWRRCAGLSGGDGVALRGPRGRSSPRRRRWRTRCCRVRAGARRGFEEFGRLRARRPGREARTVMQAQSDFVCLSDC